MRIDLSGISLSYGSKIQALSDVGLSIESGERFAIIGPSGSGKTSLLKLVAGLERPTRGEIQLGGEPAERIAPHLRGVAMTFQTPALYPHRNVAGNIGFGLEARGVKRADRDPIVNEVANLLAVGELLDRAPDELSGGQRARVALSRALADKPRALLLDEPFAGLDAPKRLALREALADLHAKFKFTMILVTHDHDDATFLADRIAVFNKGKLEQVGTPAELFETPQTVTVASLIGRPTLNLFPCRIGRGGRGATLLIPIDADEEAQSFLRLEGPEFDPDPALSNRLLIAGIRPEDIRKSNKAQPAARVFQLEGSVKRLEGVGSDAVAVIGAGCTTIRVRRPWGSTWNPGELLTFEIDYDRIHWFDPVLETRIEPKPAGVPG